MPAGRPTKYTPEIAQKICDAIRGGNYREVAAAWAGVPERTFYDWLKQRQGFSQMVKEAEQAAEIRCVALVMKAAAEDPKHAQWWLERKCHERWGRKDRMQVAGDSGAPLVHEIHVVYEDQPTTPSEFDVV